MPARKRAVSLARVDLAAATPGAASMSMASANAPGIAVLCIIVIGPTGPSLFCRSCQRGWADQSRHEVDQQAGQHDPHAYQCLPRLLAQEVDHHEERHGQKKERRQRIGPHPVGARQVRPGAAQDDDPEHGQKGAKRQAELHELHQGLEGVRPKHGRGDESLHENGGRGHAAARLARQDRQQGKVLAHRHGHPRADPHHGADGGDEADADERADDASAGIAEDLLAGNEPDVELARQLGDRRGVEEHGVEGDVEHGHGRHGDQHRQRQVPARVADLAGDVGGGVPAGIGVHDEEQADEERRAHDVAEVCGRGRKRDGLALAERQAGDDENQDQRHLQQGGQVLEHAGVLDAAQLHERGEPNQRERCQELRNAGGNAREIFAKRPSRRGNRGGKADGGRHPAGEKAHRLVIDAGEEVVFSARAREGGGKLRIGERPAQRHDAADRPQQHEREARGQVLDLETQAGEDADAHHVGDGKRGGRDERDGAGARRASRRTLARGWGPA